MFIITFYDKSINLQKCQIIMNFFYQNNGHDMNFLMYIGMQLAKLCWRFLGHFNIRMPSCQCREWHYKDKMVLWVMTVSCYNGNPILRKIVFILYVEADCGTSLLFPLCEVWWYLLHPLFSLTVVQLYPTPSMKIPRHYRNGVLSPFQNYDLWI